MAACLSTRSPSRPQQLGLDQCGCDKKLDGHPYHFSWHQVAGMDLKTSEMGCKENGASGIPVRCPQSDLVPHGKPQIHTLFSEATDERLASQGLTLEGETGNQQPHLGPRQLGSGQALLAGGHRLHTYPAPPTLQSTH